MNDIFEKLIKSKIAQFENDYINISRQIFVDNNGKLIHPGEFGTYREKIIKNFLAPFLPNRLTIGSGFIITSKNNISTQCDIIIYDKEHTPIIENGDQRFFPVECVAGVIEVKSKLSKSMLKDTLIKLTKIKALKNDINHSVYVFKDYKRNATFNTKVNVCDQMATFLVCESIDFDVEKEINTIFSEIYEGIDKSLFHNLILCLDSGCYLYFDGERPIFYPYFNYERDTFKNECIMPHILGYEKEHILLFLDYFYMIISAVSIMYLDITSYLGNPRPKKAIFEN